MKYCPSCQIVYADDTLRFCLQDGTGLLESVDNAPAPTVDFSERETVIRQKPMTSDWQPNRVTQGANIEKEAKKSYTFLAIIITALVMCLVFGGIFAVWQMLGSSNSENANNKNKTVVNDNKQNNKTTPEIITKWEATDFNASLDGERLTFYQGTTHEKCKADCDENPKCKGFGLVKAGFYNPNDPPMCYLLSKVTNSTPSACCISAVKR